MDIFHEYPTLWTSSIDISTGDQSCVRMMQITGTPEALDELQAALERREYLPRTVSGQQCCGDGQCQGISTSYEFECAPRRRLLYVYVEQLCACPSVHSIVARHLPKGTICEHSQNDGHAWWRLLMQSDEGLGTIRDQLQAAVGDDVSIEFGHVTRATEWSSEQFVDTSLDGGQQQAITNAVQQGYYERPREITIEELAAQLDIPKSTLSYRLRIAEATLVKEYVKRFEPPKTS